MAKVIGFIMVAITAVVLYGAVSIGHEAGQVMKTWVDRQETQATRTPAPLTTIIYKGGE